MRRTLLGMSQERLGEAIGLTFQQVQKYERGSNRISAGTLFRLGQVLEVPVSFFFDDYNDGHPRRGQAGAAAGTGGDGSIISRREARLLRLWRAAPGGVADEVLALLSSLSPHLRDPAEEGEAVVAADEDPVMAAEDKPARRSEKAEGRVSRGDGDGKSRKPRRRHGAVWDPTDIYRSVKG